MERFDEGLRCQDVHAGLRNVDPNSGGLTKLADTQLIGMAGSLAALIRGQEVINDAQALRAVAAEQLDVNQYAFDQVLDALAEIGFIEGLHRSGGKTIRFTENVPYYDDLYTRLGAAWHDRRPSELEEQMVLLVDHLSDAPTPAEELASEAGLDTAALPDLLAVGEGAELVKRIQLPDGDVLYSPFFGFENPEVIAELVRDHGPDQLAEAFAAVRGEQGLPIGDAQPLLQDAIGRGLLLAPAVERPDGTLQPFASLPYTLDRELLRGRKPVLEKALAVLACLRCGQHFGGVTSLPAAALVDVIDKLLDPNRGFLRPHGSHARQYRLMHSAGLLAFDADLLPGGNWVTPRFIDTEDNREALKIARDLITHGEQLSGRVGDEDARKALALGQPFTAPMQTMNRTRAKAPVSVKQWQSVIDSALGRGRVK
ncbi:MULTISPECIES: hypothetical protein [unclassified Streptomyces]|uniref:hypothetical protein n=1 Tax=unclassified Streptomyces TaxID=2593676 RepID=UPI002ED69FD1|nr:hypothetical protein OH827_10335 [Streptomyces sp. NBC_00891]WSY05393.1 hypothetical protein OG464_10335 [Streptomyces sp. NBC_00890]WSZ07017.1 hypothetical protein OG704_10335 [Streptomyces sp. NBC_00869]WSZ25485.1 hypothetical protein OG498_23230 [Streptomyces sp. NBC_00870]